MSQIQREMINLTNEDLCNIMCSSIEFDDNEYYITNVDLNRKLFEYKNIDKEQVYVVTFFGDVYRYIDTNLYDKDDVAEQFTIMKINNIEELMGLINEWDERIIIGESNSYKYVNIPIPHIIIYDGWIE